MHHCLQAPQPKTTQQLLEKEKLLQHFLRLGSKNNSKYEAWKMLSPFNNDLLEEFFPLVGMAFRGCLRFWVGTSEAHG